MGFNSVGVNFRHTFHCFEGFIYPHDIAALFHKSHVSVNTLYFTLAFQVCVGSNVTCEIRFLRLSMSFTDSAADTSVSQDSRHVMM